MEKMDLEKVINGWFNFKHWYSYKSQPLEFQNNLNEFVYINIVSSFKEYFESDIYDNYEFDLGDMVIDKDKVLTDPKEFEKFCSAYGDSINFGSLTFYSIDKPIILISAKDTTEPIQYIELVKAIKDEYELISLLNEALEDIGQVTHSSGLKSEYEVISYEK